VKLRARRRMNGPTRKPPVLYLTGTPYPVIKLERDKKRGSTFDTPSREGLR
jgi:hypothetical protein